MTGDINEKCEKCGIDVIIKEIEKLDFKCEGGPLVNFRGYITLKKKVCELLLELVKVKRRKRQSAQSSRKWYFAHHEKMKAYHRNYYQEHKEQFREYDRLRRKRLKQATQ